MPAVVVEAIRAAKMELCARDGLDFQVQLAPAVPGSPTRVLSFKGPPPFACDAAKLRNWEDPAELRYWLEWVLDDELPVEGGFTVENWIEWKIPGSKFVEMIDISQELEEQRAREDQLALNFGY